MTEDEIIRLEIHLGLIDCAWTQEDHIIFYNRVKKMTPVELKAFLETICPSD